MILVDGRIFLTLFGAEFNQLLDTKFVPVPGLQLVKVLYHERLSNLQASGEPLGKRDRTAIDAAMSLQVEDACSREVSKRRAKFQEILCRTVRRDSRRRRLWYHCDRDGSIPMVKSNNSAL